GATVVITSLDQDKLDRAAQQLQSKKEQLYAFKADVTDVESLESLKSQVQNAIGNIDILVQSAGITGAQGAFHEIDEDGWTKTIDLDLLGPVRLVRTFLPALLSDGWGLIVFLSSEDAQQPYPNDIPYCAAKAGSFILANRLSATSAED